MKRCKNTQPDGTETAALDPDFNANVNAYCPLSSAQLQFCSSRHWRSPQGGGCVKDNSLSSAVGVPPTQPHWDPGIAKYGGLGSWKNAIGNDEYLHTPIPKVRIRSESKMTNSSPHQYRKCWQQPMHRV